MIKYIYFAIIFPLFFIFSCSDNENDIGTNTNKIYKVRYEASCDNPNTVLRILYSTKNTDMENVDKDAKEIFVKSPFSVELDMKQYEFCYISVQTDLNQNEIVDDNIIYTSSISVDGVKKSENSNKTVSISYYTLGSN